MDARPTCEQSSIHCQSLLASPLIKKFQISLFRSNRGLKVGYFSILISTITVYLLVGVGIIEFASIIRELVILLTIWCQFESDDDLLVI